MDEKQTTPDESPEIAGSMGDSAANGRRRILAITFGLLQLAWLVWLGYVAWQVLAK